MMKRMMGLILAVMLLIGRADTGVDATSGATTRESLDAKTSIIQ